MKKLRSENLNKELNKDNELINLIHIAKKGFYPLFQNKWIENLEIKKQLSPDEIKLANKISEKLKKNKNIERKKIILFSLPKCERDLFINAFIASEIVECFNNGLVT